MEGDFVVTAHCIINACFIETRRCDSLDEAVRVGRRLSCGCGEMVTGIGEYEIIFPDGHKWRGNQVNDYPPEYQKG